RERRRDAPALVLHHVAIGDLGVVVHGVQPEGHAVAEPHVDVAGDPLVILAADTERIVLRVARMRRFGHLVDGARGGTAATHGAGRSLDHLDLLQVERIARVRAGVAHAIDEQAVARTGAAHGEVLIAGQTAAAFAGLEGDARRVAEYVAQGG